MSGVQSWSSGLFWICYSDHGSVHLMNRYNSIRKKSALNWNRTCWVYKINHCTPCNIWTTRPSVSWIQILHGMQWFILTYTDQYPRVNTLAIEYISVTTNQTHMILHSKLPKMSIQSHIVEFQETFFMDGSVLIFVREELHLSLLCCITEGLLLIDLITTSLCRFQTYIVCSFQLHLDL